MEPPAQRSASAAQSVTTFALGRLLNPGLEHPSLALTDEGHLMVTVQGEVMARTEALLLCSQNLDARPLNRRMQGRAVPEVFRRLVSLEGQGHLVLSRERETFHVLELQRDLCFFVEGFLWALEATLMWDVGLLPGSRRFGGISLVRVAGEGKVALRVDGELVAVKILPERPYRIHAAGFVGWVGNVVPHMQPGTPFLLCEGEGAVLVSLPSATTPSLRRAEPPHASAGTAAGYEPSGSAAG